MNKELYLNKLNELKLDKSKYCIISGGAMLMHGLKDKTNDIDLYILPEYFEELKNRFEFKQSPKHPQLFELGEDIEMKVKDFSSDDIEFVEGYPVFKLELELEWKLRHNREKDQESIQIIQNYLKSRNKL